MDITREIELFKEGCEELISEAELREKLTRSRQSGVPLRIKYGADPSAPDLHLGHTVPLRKLRQLQDLGHHVCFLIGDFTARIGDPSGRNETRPMLSDRQVQENAESYQEQVFLILDKQKTTVYFNSQWLDRMSSTDFLRLTSRYTVAQLLERDDFKKRYTENRPIALVEFLYPLLQGYDSVELKSDIELGGTDQKFNLLVGRELQRDWGQDPQIVMTMPLLEGTDGVQKMSKSFGNAIGVRQSPVEMFGKIMSIPDDLMMRYWRYLTPISASDCAQVEKDWKEGKLHPRDLKVSLAKELVSMYHNRELAEMASDEFDQVFRKKALPSHIPTTYVEKSLFEGAGVELVELLILTDLASSKTAARRAIEQGSVRVNQEKVMTNCLITEIDDLEPTVIQCGKRKFAKVLCQ